MATATGVPETHMEPSETRVKPEPETGVKQQSETSVKQEPQSEPHSKHENHNPSQDPNGTATEHGGVKKEPDSVLETPEISKQNNPEISKQNNPEIMENNPETMENNPETIKQEISETLSEGDDDNGEKHPPKNVSADDLYRRSSQYQMWSFSGPELESRKRKTNADGAKKAQQRFDEAVAVMSAESPEKIAALGQNTGGPELISYEEEQKFIRFFAQQAVQICAHFNMPTQVKATAVQFLRRFYLVHSVMEYRPKNVLYAVVFLSAKSENFFVSIEAFAGRLPKTKPDDILELEFVILSALSFTLLVHHPFRPIYGFFLDMQAVLLHPEPVMYDVSIDTIGQLYDAGKRWLNEHALLSDVAFLFSPPQIAIAALYDQNRKVTERYLKLKYGCDENGPKAGVGAAPGKPIMDQLLRNIRRCIAVAKDVVETSREESTMIDEKSFFAVNPQKLLKKRAKAASSG